MLASGDRQDVYRAAPHSGKPATLRDWFTAHSRVRLGRLDRFPFVRSGRERFVQAISREGRSILVGLSSGVRMSIPSWDVGLVESSLRGDLFEPVLMRVLEEAISPGTCVVDGGAHIGLYTIAAAILLNGDGMVISFEPDPRNFVMLERNVVLNGFQRIVRTEQLAISGSECVANLYCSPTISTRSSLLQAESDAGISVNCTSLDQYVVSNGIRRVEVLKLDLEGAEPTCVGGMRKTLSSVGCLIIEVNDVRLRAQAVDPIQFVDQIKDLAGFSDVHVCDEQVGRLVAWEKGAGLRHSLSLFGYANIVFHRVAR